MQNARVAAIVVGLSLVALWASAVAGACYVRSDRPPVTAAALPAAAPDSGAATTSLRARERPAFGRGPGEPGSRRNLFRLRDEPPPAPAAPPPTGFPQWPALAPAPDVASPPAALLLGIAERREGEATVRTAVIDAAGELWLVKEGAVVAGRYTVARIAADGVELRDTTGGTLQRLRLPK